MNKKFLVLQKPTILFVFRKQKMKILKIKLFAKMSHLILLSMTIITEKTKI